MLYLDVFGPFPLKGLKEKLICKPFSMCPEIEIRREPAHVQADIYADIEAAFQAPAHHVFFTLTP